MKNLFATALSLFLFLACSAQQFEWVKRIGNSLDHQAFILKTDAANNVYITGYFQSGFYFVPETSSNFAQAFGGDDIFIAKYSANGTFIWGKTFGGSGQDRPSGMDVSPDGNISMTGYFNGTVDFNPGSAVNNITSTGNRDIFVLKLNSTGDYAWAHKFGSSLPDEGIATCFDPNGNVFVTGYFQETVDFSTQAILQTTSLQLVTISLSLNLMPMETMFGTLTWGAIQQNKEEPFNVMQVATYTPLGHLVLHSILIQEQQPNS